MNTIQTNNRALKACHILNDYLKGKTKLTNIEIEVYKQLVKKESKKSFYYFAKYVLNFTKLTDQTHKRWCDKLQQDFWKYNFWNFFFK